MRRAFALFQEEEVGQDLVEYGLLAAFLSISAIATLRLLGPLVAALWEVILNAIS